jgi:hypothetical protein
VHSTGADPNAIAVTRVRYNSITGELTDVDIAFNDEFFDFTIVPPNPTIGDTLNKKDVENVAVHEIGHYSGLGDIHNPGYPQYVPFMGAGNDSVTMYGFIMNGETSKRSLDSPDTAGIGYIYRTIPQSKVDLILVFDGAGNFASPSAYNGFVPAKNSAADLLQRMRIGDRVGVLKLPSTVVSPLVTIQDSISRANLISAVNSMTVGGTSGIGSGLQTGVSLLTSSPIRRKHGTRPEQHTCRHNRRRVLLDV